MAIFLLKFAHPTKGNYICSMALIGIAIYDVTENRRDQVTTKCLESLATTVDWSRHRCILVVNAQTEVTAAAIIKFLQFVGKSAVVIYLPENVGTARAVNRAIRERQPDEYFVKMDNDVLFYRDGWLDDMEEAMRADKTIGILGLKRSDLEQHPDHGQERFRSKLRFVPSCIEKGRPWIVVEETDDVMGTCTMFSPALLDAVGFMYQPGYYGYDDVLMCVRSHVAGFKNCFLPNIRIDHLDPVFEEGTPDHYSGWKHASAWDDAVEYNRLKYGYANGTISIYCPEKW